ncbi:MAG: rhodanese-like domain-containing protein [Candidatus Saccharimonadales bacterium]
MNMKKVLVIIAVVIIAAVGLWILLPDSSNANTTNQTPEAQSQLNPAQTAVAGVKSGTAYIYDVRTPEEFATKHVEGAINFNVETMQSGELPPVAKDSTIYVYCRSGNRSNQAAAILKTNGFTNVTDLGGLDDLSKAGVL